MTRLTVTLNLMLAVLVGGAGVGYALPSCPDSYSNTWSNCFGTYGKVYTPSADTIIPVADWALLKVENS